MSFLYACLFSNGAIKVGRSSEPEARRQQHASRVACVGITMVEFRAAQVMGSAVHAEARLIDLCAQNATAQHRDEWFEGVAFDGAVDWMLAIAADESVQPPQCASSSFGARLSIARRNAGLTQEQLGVEVGPDGRDLGKGAVSSWEVNRSQPSATQVAQLCKRLNVSADWLLGLEEADAKAA